MEEFEVKAVHLAPHPPHVWLRFVDDTFLIQQVEHPTVLPIYLLPKPHIQHIQFTAEDAKELWCPRVPTTPLQPQCTTNLLTLTNTCTGTVTTSS